MRMSGFGDVEKREWAEIPEIFLVGDELANQAAEESGGGGAGMASHS